MKNILIFAGIAGLAAAIAIYFVTENDKNDNDRYLDEDEYVTDEDIEAYDQRENTGPAYNIDKGFNAAY
jgi:hypothetical protein